MLRMSTLIALALAAVAAHAQVAELAKDQTGASAAATAEPAATPPATPPSTASSTPATSTPAPGATTPAAASTNAKPAGAPATQENTPQTNTKTGAGSAPKGGAAADDKWEVPPGWRTEVHEDTTMYCRKEQEKGTRFKKKTCYTLEDLKFKVAQDRAQADDITRRARVCAGGSACSSQ